LWCTNENTHTLKKTLLIISILFLVALGRKGWQTFKKLRHSKRLRLRVKKFKLLRFSKEIDSNIQIEIGNFSASTFRIDQVSLELFTPSGEILARQKAPLFKSIVLKPNQNNVLPIDFAISTSVAVKELNRIGGVSSVIANFLTDNKHGLKLSLRGFVVAENVKIDINQTINV